MKKLKHNKLRNTGVLFELLVRQVASDTLNNMESKALPIIKEFFSKSTDLSKELQLYQALLKEKFKNESRTKIFFN
jgi:flagellar biosynthesis component FlhA